MIDAGFLVSLNELREFINSQVIFKAYEAVAFCTVIANMNFTTVYIFYCSFSF